MLADPVVVGNLDLARPVAVVHCLTLQLIDDTTEARRVVPLHEWWPTGPRLAPVPDAAHLIVGGVGRKEQPDR